MRKLISLFKTKKKSQAMEIMEKNLEDLKLKYIRTKETSVKNAK